MYMRLPTNVADSEEKHERIENSTQQLKDLEDTSEFVYLLSSFSIHSDLTLLSHWLTDIISVLTKNSCYKNRISLLIHNLLSPVKQVAN